MDKPSVDQRAQAVRGFWGFIGLQFQGAFSDNIFKYILILIVLQRFQGNEGAAGMWQSIIAAIFCIPFLLFSGLSGTLADKFSKRRVILATKVAEVFIMALGGVMLYFYSRSDDPSDLAFFALIGVLFLMATQSTFFSPNKYGIMPEILPDRRLAWGNGILENTTFNAIILGMVVGNGLYIFYGGEGLHRISMILVGLAIAGLISGWFIQRVPPANPGVEIKANHFPQLWGNMKIIMNDRVLLLTVMGITYFWALGAIVLTNAPTWGQFGLGMSIPELDESATVMTRIFGIFRSPAILVAPIALGIAGGSLLVGQLSKRGIELGFVPLGGLGITLFSFPLGLAQPGADGGLASPLMLTIMVVCLTLVGVSAGFFSVPLNALLQQRAPKESRGGVIAALNFINFSGILLASLGYLLLIRFFGFSAANIFTLCSILTLGATIYLMTLLPEALLGLAVVVITRFIYRINVLGGGNIPKEGPALLVSNHISLVDALLVMAVSPRPVRFIVYQKFFENPLIGFFLKIMKAIPVSADQRPRALLNSLANASEALNNGELVCIFAEGQITRTGVLLPFRRGFKQILKKAPVPVIPIYLDGVWGSIFSYERGKFIWKFPRQFPYKIRVAVGEPLPHDVSIHGMRLSVCSLSADCALARKDSVRPIHHRFVSNARRHPRRFCAVDAMTPRQRFFTVLMRSVILARRLRKVWGDQEMVGIYLPPSVGAVIVNVAGALSGKTVVNLNYTTGPDVLRHCVRQCDLKTVITSKLFIEKLKTPPPPNAVYIDDFRYKPGIGEILGGVLGGFFLPIRMLERFCGATTNPTPDTLATVIFSSGSTGVPKGIMLTHFNIASNVQGIEQAISLWPDDRLIGFLPFFHSFGYTVELWGSLCIGFAGVYHPNPLEAKEIGDLVEKHGVTVMLATPTFLQHYIRRVPSRKFGSLEFVLAGAEKLPLRVADAFEERFGVGINEGYGTSECAPVVSVNVDDYRSRGFYQVGHRKGSVGHPLPGIVVRICDPDTGELRTGGESGMIQVRGPNIMKGYLGDPEKTAEVLKDDWYITGDLGFLDEAGFLHITDRLSRFSKIAGEMVPHIHIEDELHKALGTEERIFAVTSLPDKAKGERLAVLHVCEKDEIDGMAEKLSRAGMPNLWIPNPSMFFKVDAIPILGTGKLDLSGIKRIAAERAGVSGATDGRSAVGVVPSTSDA